LPWLAAVALGMAGAGAARAVPAPFDLAGPDLKVTVTHGATTLPIAEVPNLSPGDHLWIKANMPPNQSVHYLLIAAFLSGSTNPPPPRWFKRCDTWANPCATAGLEVTVPADAEQLLVFFAPETGGDFKTLISAVRARPGAFVRTSQDLNQAALDRSRLERYLNAIHALDAEDPAKLAAAAPLLARSLAIKVDEKCLDRIPALQAPCLMQGRETLILNDGHSTSIVEALTSGPAADLAMEASYTPQLSYGYYSPYVASVLDIARIFDSFRTAQYQYIPALATQRGDSLALSLNAAPSFNNPKSVLVVALPAIEPAQLPPLHALDPQQIFCARKTSLVLPVEGAPLVFATDYAHDMSLRLTGKDGAALELPARADPTQGGFVVDTAGLDTAALGDSIQGQLRGRWGFADYDGPKFNLVNAHAQPWAMAPHEDGGLIVGREATVHLRADNVSCIDGIMLRDSAGKELKTEWKSVSAKEVELALPLQNAAPGAVTLLVKQWGSSDAQPIALTAFSEASRLDGFALHAGDAAGLLKGNRLDEVASLSLRGITFLPGALTTRDGSDELPMAADPGAAAALRPESGTSAKVTLKDGRVLPVSVTIEPPRPRVALLSKSVQVSTAGSGSNIHLADPNEVPEDATLIFSVRTQAPATFPRDAEIEVATTDEALSTSLTLANGGVTLETTKVAVATLKPAKAFGASGFGPLRFRVVLNGVAGDWQPLATLVRLPVLGELQCPASPDLACKLSGTNLFLIDALATDPRFEHAVHVPDGFPGDSLPVPHPADGQLYVKLRDAPGIVNPAGVVAEQLVEPASPDQLARTVARHAAGRPDAIPGPVDAAPGNAAAPANAAPGTAPGIAAPGIAAPGTAAPGNAAGSGGGSGQPGPSEATSGSTSGSTAIGEDAVATP
jgi:hypothetical protein